MSETFKQLKKKNPLEKLREQSKKIVEKTYENKDERFWSLTVDQAENGHAEIRFLPAPKGEEMPWVRYWNHGFRHPKTNLYYIENSLTTLGQPDPVTEYNNKLWNSGSEQKKQQARDQKRRENYVSNIYVVKDQSNPENEGKVFLFRYGKKIFEKIYAMMNPDEAFGEEPLDPFDFWEGMNFRLRAKKQGGFRNYDDSKFTSPSPLLDDDEKLEEIWESQYSLQEFVDPNNYKSYENLKERLNQVLGLNSGNVAKSAEDLADEMANSIEDDEPPFDVDEKKTNNADDDKELDLDSLLDDLDDD